MRRPLDSVTVARVGNTQKKSLHPLIVILFTLVLLCTPVQTIVTPEQVEALISLYNATHGEGWTDNLNWLNGKDPCTPGMTWSHVLTRDGAPCVDSIEQLYFVDQNMIGTLPDCFTPLEDLVSLDFTIEGGLNGNIPTSLFSLPLLQEVTFHDIPLKGSIPTEIGLARSLTVLIIHNTSLSGELPSELGNLKELRTLDLGANRFGGTFPSQWGQLESLVSFSGKGMFGEGRVVYSRVLPMNVLNLPLIKYFDLEKCEIYGEIGDSFSDSLEAIILTNNQLEGTIPSTLCSLPQLSILDVEINHLQGSIPAEFGNSRSLIDLRLGQNSLSGTIPSTLGNLSSLVNLNLNLNKLSGTLSESLGGMTSLSKFNVNSNNLVGSIPLSFEKLKYLTYFHAPLNFLTGTIPPSLLSMPFMESIILDENSLSGTIPDLLYKSTRLKEFSIRKNALTGECPTKFPTSLRNFYLDKNHISGTISQQLIALPSLLHLHIALNQLSGSVPPIISPSILFLKLDNNQLEGSVPEAICNIPRFDISNNPQLLCPLVPCCATDNCGLKSQCCTGGCTNVTIYPSPPPPTPNVFSPASSPHSSPFPPLPSPSPAPLPVLPPSSTHSFPLLPMAIAAVVLILIAVITFATLRRHNFPEGEKSLHDRFEEPPDKISVSVSFQQTGMADVRITIEQLWETWEWQVVRSEQTFSQLVQHMEERNVCDIVMTFSNGTEVESQDVEVFLTALLRHLIRAHRDRKMRGIGDNLQSTMPHKNGKCYHNSEKTIPQHSINNIYAERPIPAESQMSKEGTCNSLSISDESITFSLTSLTTSLQRRSQTADRRLSKDLLSESSETDSLLEKSSPVVRRENGLNNFRNWLLLWDPILHWFLFDTMEGGIYDANNANIRATGSAAVIDSSLESALSTLGETLDLSEAVIGMAEVTDTVAGPKYPNIPHLFAGKWKGLAVLLWPMSIPMSSSLPLTTLLKCLRDLYCLRHPGIAEVYGFILSRSKGESMMDTPALVYVVTETLPYTLEGLGWSQAGEEVMWEERVKACVDIGKAILALHSTSPPFYHGHISTKNILCDEQGHKMVLAGLEAGMVERLTQDCKNSVEVDVLQYSILILEIFTGITSTIGLSQREYAQATRRIPRFLLIMLWNALGSDVYARPSLQDMLCSFERCLPSSSS